MILVTGAAGMVGSYLLDVFPSSQLIRTDLRESSDFLALDTRNYDDVMRMVRDHRPNAVIHLGAETDVDRCEREADHAYRSNTIATMNVALACLEYGCNIVYVSTAGIFDGNKPEPYTEFDAPNPLTVYAKAKLEGEKIVQSLCARHFIVRAGWMFGGRDRDKKFVGKIAAQCLSATPEIKVVNDKLGSPTYARDLLEAVRALLASRRYGVYHVVNTGACTRYDVALQIAEYLESNIRIIPVTSADFQLAAPRPRSEAAISYKLELTGLHKMRHWREALHEYLGTWQQNKVAAG